MGFVKDVIDCGCLRFIYILELRRKRNTHFISTFILQYSSKVVFFFFSLLLELNNYNRCVCTIYNCYFL